MTESAFSLPAQRDTPRGPAAAHGVVTPADAGSALVRWSAGRPVVVLTGDIDLAAAGRVRAVGRLLAPWPHRACADAAGVTFIDVAGLRAVLDLAGPSRQVLLLEPSAAAVRLLGVLHGAWNGLRVQRDDDVEGALVVTAVQGW